MARAPVEDFEDTTSGPATRFAMLVRRAREKKGWSQRTLAEAMRLNHEVIRRIEAGADPRLSLAVRILLTLNIADKESLLQIALGQTSAKRQETV